MQAGSSRRCGNCGTLNAPQDQFCVNCGYDLNAGPALSGQPVVTTQQRRVTGALTQGALLSGRYRVVDVVGKGGFGAVYKATDERFQSRRIVAIKEMSDAQLSPTEKNKAIQDFRNEAGLLVELSHPNLPNVSDFFEDAGKVYLVMEFVQGKTLEKLLEERGGPLDEPVVLGWVAQLCDVLAYLHNQPQPIIFRDMKPSNVMVTTDGRVKLIDFGIARIFKAAVSKDTTLLGSHGYAPLEQYGRGQSDARSDIYALGASMYELLTGDLPADSPSRRVNPALFEEPRTLNPAISSETNAIILRAMAEDPKDRYQSAMEMRQDILATGQIQSTAGMLTLSGPFSTTGNTGPQVPVSRTGQPTTGTTVHQPNLPVTPPSLQPSVNTGSNPGYQGGYMPAQQMAPPVQPANNPPVQPPTRTSGSGMSRRALLIGAGTIVGAGAVGTGIYFFTRPKVDTLTIPFIFSTEKNDWLNAIINDFNGQNIKLDKQVIQIKATAEGSVKTKDNILNGVPTADGFTTPVAWSPASDLELNQLINAWKKKNKSDLVFTSGDMAAKSLVQSPLVFAFWQKRADKFVQNYKSQGVDWTSIHDAVGKNSWGDIGGDDTWGPVKLGQTRPDSSNSGLLSITLMAYAHYHSSRGLTTQQVNDGGFKQYLSDFEVAVHQFGRSSGSYLTDTVISTNGGPAAYDIVLTYENLVLTQQNKARQAFQQALLPFYPKLNMISNHPFVIFKGNGITDVQQQAARKFRDFLLDVPQQRKALLSGFRPTNLSVSITDQIASNPFNVKFDPLANGQTITIPDQITNIASSPDGDTVDALIDLWLQNYNSAPTALSITPDTIQAKGTASYEQLV